MNDHKYTDEEVIRACECCASSELTCDDCPGNNDASLCTGANRLLIDVAKRLQAQAERPAQRAQELLASRLGAFEVMILEELGKAHAKAKEENNVDKKEAFEYTILKIREIKNKLVRTEGDKNGTVGSTQ